MKHSIIQLNPKLISPIIQLAWLKKLPTLLLIQLSFNSKALSRKNKKSLFAQTPQSEIVLKSSIWAIISGKKSDPSLDSILQKSTDIMNTDDNWGKSMTFCPIIEWFLSPLNTFTVFIQMWYHLQNTMTSTFC